MKKQYYYILTTLFVMLGLSFAIILTYNHFYADSSISLFCAEGSSSYLDCNKVSQGKYSSLFGIPISVFGIAFYISVVFYYTLPTLNEKGENLLKVPFLIVLILANLIDILLLLLSVFVINSFCTQCSMIYIANLGILIVFYLAEFRTKSIGDEITNFFSSLKKDFNYQKDLTIFFSISILFFFLLLFFSKNKALQIKLEKAPEETEVARDHSDDAHSDDAHSDDVPSDRDLDKIYDRKVKFESSAKLPYTGNKDAPIDILVFHDLQCRHCQNSFFVMERELKEYAPLFKIRYFNLPFGKSGRYSQLNSFQLALYSWVAFHKGKYDDFLRSLFTKFRKGTYIDKEEISKTFKEIGIVESFSRIEEESLSYVDEIKRQAEKAREFFIKIGAQSIGTPSIFINGRFIGIGHKKDLINKVVLQEIIDFAKSQSK